MIFEEAYIQVRKKEGFLYEDDIVKQLPHIGPNHKHHSLWKKRAKSCSRFINYLHRNSKFRKVLDFGCGNGWFTNKISQIDGIRVSGWDINQVELEQARRVFQKDNIEFQRMNIFESENEDTFDLIVLNACIQYFGNVGILIKTLQKRLNPAGEIHILDSPVYKENEIQEAARRSINYFDRMNCPQMNTFYHHHCWKEFNGYSFQVLYNPNTIWNKIRIRYIIPDSPFPWIVIKQ